ncbi:hypothetical protein B9Q01_01835 [Candidatus Marsarchaeota G1 archaeon OSP_D]|uniref:4Fe-4S ferredoxin-type domain-containing protein n=3 Tax=Candidatus Marsarchaeota group 1 TaxID=2203770 RepID=A0A2R6AJF8_9ARCH|nr:MAG: hypothetical protein B9Q01_01835 [Candidatus Marsarchaeota G1 archaeon OSP_D]PSN86507.1 MAG: hypothetical protein B9Q02_02010 [Candidatus Marsarchaeota G1 archaeon BE_D]PSN89202.1 MAG: hypothetical protein B9Q00_02300 [Candidatus Marsarchaeota G1 archaeon OSP_C]
MPESVETLLAHDKWDWDTQSHIKIVDQELCRKCESKPCLIVCPARVYTWEKDHIAVNYQACLELRACYVACHEFGNGAIQWNYPRGGKGVIFKLG